MLVYRVDGGVVTADAPGGAARRLRGVDWDGLFTGRPTQGNLARIAAADGEPLPKLPEQELLPPIASQEVWAAGVTYQSSRRARVVESAAAGMSGCYDHVYHAHRPELFFKATPHRVVGHRQSLALRGDSEWMVPEPELTLAFNCHGALVGYTIGNDLSSRDIEGQNPLYLPQAKVFDRCAALGPGLLLSDALPSLETRIEISILRAGQTVFAGETRLNQMKQPFENLREHLFRHNSFPNGCYLMTGTGIVPGDDFTLHSGDLVSISIDGVGTLINDIA